MSASTEFTTSFATAADGTIIGYRQIGSGPGVVMVHGALQSSGSFTQLARALSGNFTVYIVDRRGRGLSGPYGENDNIITEANDMLSVVRQTKSSNIFGLSSGAIITMQAALLYPGLKKVVLYEPPIPIADTTFKNLNKDYDRAMQKGDLGRAFVAVLKGTGDKSFFASLPAFISGPLFNRMLRKQAKKSPNPNKVPLQHLIPTFQNDRIVANASPPLIAEAAKIQAGVLLLGGSKSRRFLTVALNALAASIPHAKRVEFKGLGHIAADNSGDPKKVAGAMAAFFINA